MMQGIPDLEKSKGESTSEFSAARTELFITADGENNQGHENSAKSLRKLRQPGAVPKMDGSYLQNDLHSFSCHRLPF